MNETTARSSIDPSNPDHVAELASYSSMSDFPTNSYFNIFVYAITTGQGRGYTPSGLNAILVDPGYFGAYPTSAHEAGHWFGLQNGGDEYNIMHNDAPFYTDRSFTFNTGQLTIMNSWLQGARVGNVCLEQTFANEDLNGLDKQGSLTAFGLLVNSGNTVPVPPSRDFVAKTNSELRGSLKHLRWNYTSTLSKMKRTINYFGNMPIRERAQFASLFPVTVNVSVEGFETDGQVDVLDPWYVDNEEQALQLGGWITYSSGFKQTTMPRNGVFLGQGGPQDWAPPHYSIGAQYNQNIMLSGQSLESYFQGWKVATGSAYIENAGSQQTGVSFNDENSKVIAEYKAHCRTTVALATGPNIQRKICYANGKYHATYESMGEVWYCTSTDNGSSWSNEYRISDGSGLNRQPSIAVRQSRDAGQSYLSVLWERHEGEFSDILVRYLQSNSTWTSPTVLWNGVIDQDCEGATPSMAMENTFEVAVWRVKSSSEWYPSGLYLWFSTDGAPYIIDGTGTTSIHPSIAVPAFQSLEERFAVAWSDNGQIYYKPFRWYHEELTSSATENPSSGSGLSQHDYPSLVYISSFGRRPALAWQAYSTYIEANVVLARERGTSSWGTIQQYSRDESYLHPSLTRHEYSDTSLVMAWHDGSNMYLAKRTTTWGARTNLSSGRYPGLGLDPDGDNTHFRIVYTTGASAPYQIATTNQGLPKSSGGDVEMRRIVALSNGAAYSVVLEKAALLTSQGETSLQQRAVNDPGRAFRPEEASGMVSTANFIVPRGARLRIEASSEASKEKASASYAGELSAVMQIIDASTGELLAVTTIDTVSAKKTLTKHQIYSVDLTSLAGKEVRLALVLAFKGKADLWTLTEISHDTTGVTPHEEIQKQMNAESKPQVFALAECFPNPFNPTTTIGYQLPTDGFVKLVVYDLLGRQVAELASGLHAAGRYSARWNASSVASGMYFARLTVMDEMGQIKFNKISKLVLAK